MKLICWSEDKNEWLKEHRQISFEEVVFYLSEDDCLLDIVQNPNYPTQKNFILRINSYAHIVPFVENDDEIFLKTIFPSRKATQHYLTPPL